MVPAGGFPERVTQHPRIPVFVKPQSTGVIPKTQGVSAPSILSSHWYFLEVIAKLFVVY